MLVYLNNLGFVLLCIIVAKIIYRIPLRSTHIRETMSIAITFSDTLLAQIIDNSDLTIVISLVTVWIVLCIMFDEKTLSISVYSVAIFGMMSVMVQMAKEMISAMLNSINLCATERIREFIALIILLIVIPLVENKNKSVHGLKDVSFRYHVLLMVIIIIDCICVTFLGIFVSQDLDVEHKWIIELSYAFTVLGVFVQLGLLIAMILSRDEHKEKEALNAKYLEEQVSHYEYLEEREQETRKFRHDMRNHLMILRNLYDTGKTKEFEKYFDTITDRITNFGNQISVGNNTADAIINQYAKEAELAGITLQVEGYFPVECHIDAVDICTIFANLLSNAIRAEKESGGHQVNLIVRNMDNELFIQVQNDYVTQIKRSGERFVSTKEDRGNHGFGLQNVYDCVERNHGIIHITTDNQIFDVKLSLKNTEA